MDKGLSKKADLQDPRTAPSPGVDADAGPEPLFDLIELMFFAYRDFVGDADHLLENFSLGRAHHRVLHFVNRRPGLTIAELLDILKITKQSLNRVLKELLDQNYVEARPGATDRRQRRLYPTPRGRVLALSVAHLQSKRFAQVFAKLGDGARSGAIEFLLAMVNASERGKVAALIGSDAAAPAFPAANAGAGLAAPLAQDAAR